MRFPEAACVPYAEEDEGCRNRKDFSVLDITVGVRLPNAGIAEILGGVSSGKTTLAHLIVSSFVRRGEFAAWVDLPNAFDPYCALDAGVDLDRLLWVAPADPIMAIRTTELVLGVGGFRVVVLDLGCSDAAKRRVSTSAWLRMSRAAALRRAMLLVLGSAYAPGSFATLSLESSGSRPVFSAQGGPFPFFRGASSSLRVRKFKGGPLLDRPVRFFATPE